MKSEPNPSTNGSSFNFGNFTPHDTGDMQFGGDISNQHAATAMNGTESYLLGLEESEYLLAPFDSSADIFAFRGGSSIIFFESKRSEYLPSDRLEVSTEQMH